MKTRSIISILTVTSFFAILSEPARADEQRSAERHARLFLADIDQKVLAEQYRHVQMEAFKARLELRMGRLELEYLSEPDRENAKREMNLQAERLELFEETSTQLWKRILNLHVEVAEMEAAPDPKPELQGKWTGREQESDTEIRLVVEGEHAKFEVPSEGLWYKGKLIFEQKGGGFWAVAFHIEECAEPDYDGKISVGLARINGDRFVLAANEPGNPSRPSRLKPSDETQIFVFERE